MNLKTETQLRQEIEDAWKMIRQYQAALPALPALQKDAERYRWLRHGDNDDICIEFADGLDGMYADQVWLLRGEKLDAVIDAGIAHDKDEAAHTVAVPAVGAA